ncbi:hypothetical protein CF319_g8889 [Tilletia indica]|nr:hypothetical protein CF319_g8889 [Tilletia indica]
MVVEALARKIERQRLGLRAVRETREVKRANRHLAKEVSKARQKYHRERLDSLQGPEIYAAAKWALGRRSYPSPPLSDAEGRLVVEAEEKRKLLRDTLIPPLPTPPRPAILDDDPRASALPHDPVTWLEVRSAVFDPSPKKAAGPDEIGFAALRALWPVVNGFLHRLVCLCLAEGHMPASFKESTLVALRKPGRRDPSKPRSYRLIALQQCLGKVLERVLSRRLTYIASVLNLVPSEQYGAMPGKSAVDAAVALHHDVECAWNQATQRTLAMLNFDIQGAYDSVLPGLLVLRLHALGLPHALIRFVWSFLVERKVVVRLDGSVGAEAVSSRGLPQGSSLSPILFLLFVSPVWQLFGDQEIRWEEQGLSEEELNWSQEEREACRQTQLAAFVDDKSLRTTGNDHEELARRLQLAFGVAQRWYTANGLTIDAVKRELIYFVPPALRQLPLPEVQLGAEESDIITPVPLNGSVRWLGVWFDPKLSFATHVSNMAARARSAAGCLRMLGNTVRGMVAADLRRLHLACVQPLLLWAAAVWWWGRQHRDGTRPYAVGERAGLPREGHLVRTSGAAGMVEQLEVAQNASLRCVLPVYRTTPVLALQIEASIPPIELALDRAARRFARRLWTLPDDHPLLLRLAGMPGQPKPVNRDLLPPNHLSESPLMRAPTGPTLSLDRSAAAEAASRSYTTILVNHASRIEGSFQRTISSAWAPWSTPLTQLPRVTVLLEPREQAVSTHSQLLQQAGRNGDMVAYSDASLMGANRGVGVSVRHGSQLCLETHWSVTAEAEVFDLEAWGLFAAFCHAVVAQRPFSTHIVIFTDNLSVVRSAMGQPRGSSQQTFLRLQQRVQHWLAVDPHHHLTISWIPGHSNIEGNERADQLARAGAARESVGGRAAEEAVWEDRTLASFQRWDRQQLHEIWDLRWDLSKSDHDQYAKYRLRAPTLRPSPDLTLPRRLHGLLLSVRTGHGDFAPYHERFDHNDASLNCRCEAPKTPEHPLLCETYALHQHLLHDDNGQISLPWLLDSRQGSLAFARYAQASNAFNCNHQLPLIQQT